MLRRAPALLCGFSLAFLTVNCAPSTGSGTVPGSGGTPGSGGLSSSSSGGSGSGGTGTGGSSETGVAGGEGTGTGGTGTGGRGTGGAATDGASTGGRGTAGAAAGGGSKGGSAGGTSGGTGGGGPAAACPGDAVFCDDFESYTDMTAPPAPKWNSWTVGAGKILVDTAQAYSGTKAAHFHGKVSQACGTKAQAFMLAQGAPTFPISGPTAFVRFMLYGTRFPFTGVTTANHIAMAWIGSSNGLNSPDRGETGKGYLFGDYNGVSIEPMWAGLYRDTSVHFKDASEANKWHCWEFAIDNEHGPPSGQTGMALPHIWEDGVERKLTPAGSGDNFPAIPFEAVLFSLWSPQTDTSASDYWIDDVVISKSRINCPAAK